MERFSLRIRWVGLMGTHIVWMRSAGLMGTHILRIRRAGLMGHVSP